MFKYLLVTLIAIAVLFVGTSSLLRGSPDCFRKHLQEAIEINRHRQGLYSELSGGQTQSLSRVLIWSEKLSVYFVSPFVDFPASRLGEKGTQLICDAFIPMSKTPAFKKEFTEGAPQAEDFAFIEIQNLKEKLSKQLSQGEFSLIEKELEAQMLVLQKEPRLNCMTRHMFESILRISDLGQNAEMRYGPDQSLQIKKLALWLIQIHLYGFQMMKIIDERALAFQAQGLPIICQDVPHIPRARLSDF